MQAGFERGMNWVDTAEAYGAGHSEELVGQAIAKRDDILVFSKVVFKPFGSGLDAVGIRTGAQASLRREVLALYQIHLPDPTIPIEESWGAMARLVEEGLVRFTRSQEQKLLSGRKNSLNSLQEGNYGHDH
jgi:aryl-alcohol dehydrogenase-like predicted oxidoreductase